MCTTAALLLVKVSTSAQCGLGASSFTHEVPCVCTTAALLLLLLKVSTSAQCGLGDSSLTHVVRCVHNPTFLFLKVSTSAECGLGASSCTHEVGCVCMHRFCRVCVCVGVHSSVTLRLSVTEHSHALAVFYL